MILGSSTNARMYRDDIGAPVVFASLSFRQVRSAAFMPLQAAHSQTAPNFSATPPFRALKRHECRAPLEIDHP
jgi:hypothetical protein